MAEYPQIDPPKTHFNRKFLNILIIATILSIIILYNIPGGVKPWETAENKDSAAVSEDKGDQQTADNASTEGYTFPDTLQSIKQISVDSSSPVPPLNIQHWTNKKGANIYFVEAKEIPMVDIRLVFDAGAARDGKLPGLARLTNSMLEEGSKNHDVEEIAKGFEAVGAVFSASSYRDMAVLQLRSLTKEKWLTPALDLFEEVVSTPTFPKESFQRLQKLSLLSLEQRQQSPKAKLGDALYKALYGDHPYGIPPQGTSDSLKAITLDDLRQFHHTFYSTKNLVVAIVGDINRAEAEKMADRVTADLPEGERAASLPPIKPLDKAESIFVEHPSTQTHINIATHSIRRGDDRFFPLMIGNEILGGGGFASVLNEEIRQKRGYSYSVYSYFVPMLAEGPFIISFETKTESAKDALKVAKDTLKEFIEKGPTDEQITLAKRQLVNAFPLQLASNSSINGQLGSIGFYQLPLDYLDHYIDNIKSVTKEQIQTAFKEMIDPDKLLVVQVGQPQPKPAEKQP